MPLSADLYGLSITDSLDNSMPSHAQYATAVGR